MDCNEPWAGVGTILEDQQRRRVVSGKDRIVMSMLEGREKQGDCRAGAACNLQQRKLQAQELTRK